LKPRGRPDPELYEVRKETLALLEQQSQRGLIDLYYGDESQVSEVGYVPYGWQFADEQVHIAAGRGRSRNYFGLLSRSNEFVYRSSEATITSRFVLEQLDAFSLVLVKPTVVVLDNARIHTAKQIKERLGVWQRRGLYVFYLPPYSPQLNIIERLWKELKARWLRASDYESGDALFYATELALAAVGKELRINFSAFRL
jgi:transposase